MFYGMVVRRLGLMTTLLAGIVGVIAPILLVPLITLLPSGRVAGQLAALAVCLGAKSVFAGSAFTSSMVLLNKSVR